MMSARMNTGLPSRPSLVLVLAGALLGADARADDGCLSAACHAPLVEGKQLHAAAESCESCHEVVAAPHPQPGQRTFKLSAEPPALCAACHELPAVRHAHAPVEAGLCTA